MVEWPLNMLHTLLEMKIAICQEGYFYLDKILRVFVINCIIAVSGRN
ncbi:hypothetical protein T4B_9390 [Trichinella pseudospiralis]|uniref:Uncharacterized protein n=1 Tax=Trichinella pseudospiralis TaxID=6337 RepID=A0A0V1G8F5_TRIPS|nr:hypothetical protein T4B_9390 [Trichinella pseudospiralis]